MIVTFKLNSGLKLTIGAFTVTDISETKFQIDMQPQQLAIAHIEDLPNESELNGDHLIINKQDLVRVQHYNI